MENIAVTQRAISIKYFAAFCCIFKSTSQLYIEQNKKNQSVYVYQRHFFYSAVNYAACAHACRRESSFGKVKYENMIEWRASISKFDEFKPHTIMP